MKHRSDPKILNERTLERDHRRLSEILEPGMRVLDAGCGTGAISAGIARRVGERGQVIGIDRDAGLLAVARAAHANLANLSFEQAELRGYSPARMFDVATAARVLQWIAPPLPALDRLCAAVRPGGWVVVLDYNHGAHTWDPPARGEFRLFYEAFLKWRAANGWSNAIADELPAMFQQAGLVDVESREESETDLERVSGMWTQIIEGLGPALVEGGWLGEAERVAGREANEGWRTREGRGIRLELKSVWGRKTGSA